MVNKEDNQEDIVYEDDGISAKVDGKLQKLKEELLKCKEEKQEYLDGWQRSQAEFVNYKKRVEEEKNNIRTYAIEDFVLELIPAIDNFEMAFQNEEVWNSVPENWRQGIEYIHQQMLKVLEDHNVISINPIGEHFNPQIHDSIETIPVDDESKDGVVMAVMKKGYSLKDKNIRPASVKIGHYEK